MLKKKWMTMLIGVIVICLLCFSQTSAVNVENENPVDEDTGISLTPTVEIDIADDEGDAMDILFLTNTSGDWTIEQGYSAVDNSTQSWNY